MYEQQELSKSLSSEDFIRTLRLSDLTEQETYTEVDADIFFKCRELINQGKNDDEILHLLPDIITTLKPSIEAVRDTEPEKTVKSKKKTSKTKDNSQASKNISDLLVLASEQNNLEISLAQAVDILKICGWSLSNISYSPSECELFLSVCKSLLTENKNPEEVMNALGTASSDQTNDVKLKEAVEIIGDKVAKADEQLAGLIDKITSLQSQDVSGLVNKFYLKNVVQNLQNDTSEDNLFAQLEQRIIARIQEKKFPAEILTLRMEEKQQLIPSSEKLMILPSESGNGTSTD